MTRTLELMKKDDRSVVLCEHDNGKIEYVVCSYYDPAKPFGSQWCWGHYFGACLDKAIGYLTLDLETLSTMIADYIYSEGVKLSCEGNYTCPIRELEQKFNIAMSYDLKSEITDKLKEHPGVLNAWCIEEHGEMVFDVNFSNAYCGVMEWEV